MTGHCLKQEPPATFPKKQPLRPRGRSGVWSTPGSNGVNFGAVKATDYAGTGVPTSCFFNHSVVEDLGRTIGYPIARAMTACEQIPNARETEKSTV